MKVVLAARDDERADWLMEILSGAGYTVALLPDPTPSAPELKGAELLIADREGAAALQGAGPRRRMLLAPRDGTVDLQDVRAGFDDVIAFPSDADEIVARIRHLLSG